MQTVVVFNKKTREVIAAIPLNGGDAVVHNDVDFEIFSDIEPVFEDTPTGPKLKVNSFFIMPHGGYLDGRGEPGKSG